MSRNISLGLVLVALLLLFASVARPDIVCDRNSACCGPVVAGGGGSGANTALSNLAAVAINTSLIPGTAGGSDLGGAALPWKDLWLSGTSTSPETQNYRITGDNTSGVPIVLTLPNADGAFAMQFSPTVQEFTGGLIAQGITVPEGDSLTIGDAGVISFMTVGPPFYDLIVSSFGHIVLYGNATPPLITSCGTAPSGVVGWDHSGTVTTGTGGPTSCAMTFTRPWSAKPICHCNNETAIVVCQAVSTTTTLTLNSAAAMNSNVLTYTCGQGTF
jgi:hypothetical protein